MCVPARLFVVFPLRVVDALRYDMTDRHSEVCLHVESLVFSQDDVVVKTFFDENFSLVSTSPQTIARSPDPANN